MQSSVQVDFTRLTGPVKPMHGLNNAPFSGCDDSLFPYLTRAGIPFSRLHDTGGRYGGSVFVDIENVFRDFEADPHDPASYDFAFTDWLLCALHRAGVEPFYRLGATIENDHAIRAYHIFPPKSTEKWAEICDGIIRHYNEGWADGFHLGIRYWEIWNEPDNQPEIADNPMWKGSMEEFFHLYEVTARLLKSRHPELKIGGYGSCGFYSILNVQVGAANSSARTDYFLDFFEKFLTYISSEEHRAPLDFFSWHSYSGIDENLRYAIYARERLNRHGFTDTESILNEWNPGIQNRGEIRDASQIAGMMCAMQKSPLDKLLYYDGQINAYSGLWNPVHPGPFPGYYAFEAFNRLYRLENEVESVSGCPALRLCAARKDACSALLLVNTGDEALTVTLRLTGLAPKSTLRLRRLDAQHAFEETAAMVYTDGAAITLEKDAILLLEAGE